MVNVTYSTYDISTQLIRVMLVKTLILKMRVYTWKKTSPYNRECSPLKYHTVNTRLRITHCTTYSYHIRSLCNNV